MELEPPAENYILKVYLDVCCLNRPFDDWAQERIRLEGDTILSILERIRAGQWQLINSEAIAVELEKMRNLEKKEQILKLLEFATEMQVVDEAIDARAQQLESLGFALFDAFHLACAEATGAGVFLSTDDRLLRNALRHRDSLKVEVQNPVVWFMTVLQSQ
ncbi:type II toxin-antitoxin system VapC family toxin [Pantanalinema sp. GBBB05]|uniref:type II toxin-antitoxin system VapC family toxin n=1 Tax=Pantanalinema sp. GBBB05 TaxID=2604139 RepID=UPI003D814686